MEIINLIILIFLIFNLSIEISSDDFYYIEPNTFLKGSKVNIVIHFNEQAEIWNNSTSIKIGDNIIPLENCHNGRNKEDYSSNLIHGIYCNDIILDGDNTEIIYGGVVQTSYSLELFFVDEYSIYRISNYLSKDSYEEFKIYSNIAAGLKYRLVKLGNYVANCNSSIEYYTNCYVKIEEEGNYTLTIDGKEYKINEGTSIERSLIVTVLEYKITELPILADSIDNSEELTFTFKMLNNDLVKQYSFFIGNNEFFCDLVYDSNNIKIENIVKCKTYIYLKNPSKDKEIQYFYYYEPKNQKYVKTDVSIVVKTPKILKIIYYSTDFFYNDNYYLIENVKSTIILHTNLNTLFNQNKDKIKIGNNELFQCNKSSANPSLIFCYVLINEGTLKKDGTYEYFNIKLNEKNTGLSVYLTDVLQEFSTINSISVKFFDYCARENEKIFKLKVDSSFQIEKSQIYLKKDENENKIILSCEKSDNFFEIYCSGIVSEGGNYYVYINETKKDLFLFLRETPAKFNYLISIEPQIIFVNKKTNIILTFDSANDLNIDNFFFASKEFRYADINLKECTKINSFQFNCSITITNIGTYLLKKGYNDYGEIYCTNEYMTKIYRIHNNILFVDEKSSQNILIKVDANYNVKDHSFKLVPVNSALDNLNLFCSTSYEDNFGIDCEGYFFETGEYFLYLDDINQNLKVYVFNNKTKIVSEINEIIPNEINFTNSVVSFELISDTNEGIKYLNLSLNLYGFSYYLQCEPSSESSIKSICTTQFKSFGIFYLKLNNYHYYENTVKFNVSKVIVNNIEILNVTPYKFDIDSNNVQKFQITCSSDFGDDFLIFLYNQYVESIPNCIKKNSTNIECSFLFNSQNIYKVKMNSDISKFKLYAGVEVNETGYDETTTNESNSNSNYQNNHIEEDDYGIFHKLSFKIFTLICLLF